MNGQFLNHCLVAFLKRIADPDGMNLEPMLWQVRVNVVVKASGHEMLCTVHHKSMEVVR